MTSKEALNQLYIMADTPEIAIGIQSCYDIVEKELEVLDILKQMLEVKKGSTWFYLDTKHCFFDTQEQLDLVKGWLENG